MRRAATRRADRRRPRASPAGSRNRTGRPRSRRASGRARRAPGARRTRTCCGCPSGTRRTRREDRAEWLSRSRVCLSLRRRASSHARLIIVTSATAQSVSSPPRDAVTAASHTVSVRPARTTSPRSEQLALGRCQQVELELDGQHLTALRHERQGGVARGAVRDRRHHTGVHVIVLLGQLAPGPAGDRTRARPDFDELCAEVPHEILAREACAHSRLGTCCCTHGGSLSHLGVRHNADSAGLPLRTDAVIAAEVSTSTSTCELLAVSARDPLASLRGIGPLHLQRTDRPGRTNGCVEEV